MIMKSRSGKSLRDPQPRSIDGILRVWQHGALVGDGSARGPVLGRQYGVGKNGDCRHGRVQGEDAARARGVSEVCHPGLAARMDDWHPRPGVVRVLPRQPHLDFDIGWAMTNYEMLERFSDDLRRRRWDLVVLDEAHATKEPSRRRTILIHGGVWKDKAYRPIPARKALVISGTPMKNRVEEMFTTLNFLDPDNWPDRDAFIDAHYEERTERRRAAHRHRRRAAWCRTSRRGTSTPCTAG